MWRGCKRGSLKGCPLVAQISLDYPSPVATHGHSPQSLWWQGLDRGWAEPWPRSVAADHQRLAPPPAAMPIKGETYHILWGTHPRRSPVSARNS